jgi:hypothetical protein
MNRAFATVAFVCALALSPASAVNDSGMAHDCSDVSTFMQKLVDICFDEAQLGITDTRVCEVMVENGNHMIQWCNSNINLCPADSAGVRRVEWDYHYGIWGTTSNPIWSIGCVEPNW